MEDKYGSALREQMKESMSEPAKPFRALNRKPMPFLSTLKLDRRQKYLRRFWWNLKEDLGFYLIMVAILVAGAMAWLSYGTLPR